jgi:hypothetical protein
MSSSEQPLLSDPAALADLNDRELQRLLAQAVKVYAQRQQEGEPFPVFAPDETEFMVTGTDAVIAASAMLDATSVEIFELGMWKTWGTVS